MKFSLPLIFSILVSGAGLTTTVLADGDKAATTEETPAPSPREKTVKTDTKLDNMGESERNRVGKNVSIVGEAGLGIAPFPTVGGGAGYYVMPNLIAEVNYVRGSVTLDKVDVAWSLMGARAKWFWGNSAYLNAGLSQRTFSFKSELASTTAGVPDVEVKADAKTLGLDIGIGNRWQWDYFSLGCDWIGYLMPLSASGDSKINVPGVDTKEQKDLNDVLKTLGKTPSFQLLRFYMGVSF